MSYQEAADPQCDQQTGVIELRIEPKTKNLGNFSVRRVLPATERKMVGPFIFFDHIGPAEFPPGEGINVRPHPHIGIATITYLFSGEIMHRDSLGFVQPIQAGAVNLMTAGRGIVHSERAGSDIDRLAELHGIQSWMALPNDKEEIEPAFEHVLASDLPEIEVGGANVRVIIGEAYGKQSPVSTFSSMLYLECRVPKNESLALPDSYQELAVYVVEGNIQIDGTSYAGGVLAIARAGQEVSLKATENSRVMVLGGEHLGEREIWWNFVSSSPQLMAKARSDWKEGRFGKVPGDDEFIPLPE